MKDHSDTNFDTKAYWEDRLKRNYDIKGVGWLKMGSAYNRWTYFTKKKVVERVLRTLRLDVSKSRVLDIGSGTGYMIDRWSEWGAREIIGSDMTEVAVSKLGSRYPKLAIKQVDIGRPSARDIVGENAYDIVSCFDVLYHVVDDQCFDHAIANIAAALKPGGHLFLTDYFLKQPPVLTVPHVAQRSRAEYERAFERHGLEIAQCKPLYIVSYPPIGAPSSLFTYAWYAFTAPMRFFPFLGSLYGPLMTAMEFALFPFCTEGPGLKVVTCRKKTR